MPGKSYDSYNSVYAVCPFYKGEDQLNIQCEGLRQGGSVINHFPSLKTKELYVSQYCRCMEHHTACPIHRMMTRIWRGDWRL